MNSPANAATAAVFLSYASQDAEAARALVAALRAAGVEVWFDQNELVGGDAWDAKIRGQIAACALFVPVISAATQARREGYFRLEWNIAAQRTHMMARGTPFLLPVVIDTTRDGEALVPEEFKAVQWTRLPGGEATPAFCARVKQVLGGGTGKYARGQAARVDPSAPDHIPSAPRKPHVHAWPWVFAGAALVGGVFFVLRPPAGEPVSPVGTPGAVGLDPASPPVAGPAAAAAQASRAASTAEPAVSEKSLVVLPLENLSPDPDNAYFTEGIHAEIISTLTQIADLKVISRSSALAFKGANASLAEIAQKLGVANVITGSVRRANDKVRIQLELRRASDEALLWSLPKGDRDLQDVLTLQSEIAEQVARVLQARLATGSFLLGRFTTQNPRAYDCFLRALALFNSVPPGYSASPSPYVAVIEQAEQAMSLDPAFAGAATLLATSNWFAYRNDKDPVTRLRYAAESKRWAETGSRLAPGGAGDYGLASYYGQASRDYARGLTYAQNVVRALPNEATGYNYVGIFSDAMGQEKEALSAWRRAITLDPLRPVYWSNYLGSLVRLRRVGAFQEEKARYHASTRGTDNPEWQFALFGEIPSALDGMAAAERIGWLWRARRVADVVALAEAELGKSATQDLNRLIFLRYQTDGLQKLGRTEAAGQSAAALMSLVQKLAEIAEVGPSQKNGWQALALSRLGRADEAVSAARRHLDVVRNLAPRLLSERERELAELHAYLNRPHDCVELLAKLLRVPWGLTVPMLKADPAWDNVREDAGFQALLDDPKNTSPL